MRALRRLSGHGDILLEWQLVKMPPKLRSIKKSLIAVPMRAGCDLAIDIDLRSAGRVGTQAFRGPRRGASFPRTTSGRKHSADHVGTQAFRGTRIRAGSSAVACKSIYMNVN